VCDCSPCEIRQAARRNECATVCPSELLCVADDVAPSPRLFVQEHSVEDILAAFDDLQSIDDGVYEDTQWLAKVMCNMAQPENSAATEEEIATAADIVRKFHREVPPHLGSVKPYLVQASTTIPGLKKKEPSKKGKKTKVQVLDDAIKISGLPVLAWDDSAKEYLRLRLDIEALEKAAGARIRVKEPHHGVS
jgi:hypothetical protein